MNQVEALDHIIFRKAVALGCPVELHRIGDALRPVYREAVIFCGQLIPVTAGQDIQVKEGLDLNSVLVPQVKAVGISVLFRTDLLGPPGIQLQIPASRIIVEGKTLVILLPVQVQGIRS